MLDYPSLRFNGIVSLKNCLFILGSINMNRNDSSLNINTLSLSFQNKYIETLCQHFFWQIFNYFSFTVIFFINIYSKWWTFSPSTLIRLKNPRLDWLKLRTSMLISLMAHLKTRSFWLKFSNLTVVFLLRGFIMWNLVQWTWPLHHSPFLSICIWMEHPAGICSYFSVCET